MCIPHLPFGGKPGLLLGYVLPFSNTHHQPICSILVYISYKILLLIRFTSSGSHLLTKYTALVLLCPSISHIQDKYSFIPLTREVVKCRTPITWWERRCNVARYSSSCLAAPYLNSERFPKPHTRRSIHKPRMVLGKRTRVFYLAEKRSC